MQRLDNLGLTARAALPRLSRCNSYRCLIVKELPVNRRPPQRGWLPAAVPIQSDSANPEELTAPPEQESMHSKECSDSHPGQEQTEGYWT